MMEKTSVTIIIPTFNRAKLLLRSIESIKKQSYENWELIIVDDCSEDETQQAISNISDRRIHYIRNDCNMGAAASRNRGAELAQYEYLAFQDSDDVWRVDKLEKQMDFMMKNTECDLVYCSFLNHYLDGRQLVVPNNQIGEREGWIFNTLLVNNVIGTPTMLIKKEIFLRYGGFDTELRALEDWDFALRVSKDSQIGFLPEILVDAYQTDGSISCDGGGYYEARCKMLASNASYLQKIELFDELVLDLFQGAEQRGVLDAVQQLFMLSLKKYQRGLSD